MDKKRGLAVVGMFWLGLALAGGCESTSGGTARRTTPYTPSPSIGRNGAPASPGAQAMTAGVGASGTNTGATGSSTGGTAQPIGSGLQPAGTTVDPNARGSLPITDPNVLQTGSQLKDISRLCPADTTAKPAPMGDASQLVPMDNKNPTPKSTLLPATGSKSWDLPPVSPLARDDGLGSADRIRINNTPGGAVLPPPPPSTIDGLSAKPLPPPAALLPAAPVPPAAPLSPPPSALPDIGAK